MKNYLLKITSVSILCFSLLVSCSSDDDSSDEENTAENFEGETTQNLTECFDCPPIELTAVIASNDNTPVTTVTPAAIVCKGEDGKAYLDGVLNEDNQDYESYLQIRQMQVRCSALTN